MNKHVTKTGGGWNSRAQSIHVPGNVDMRREGCLEAMRATTPVILLDASILSIDFDRV
jgi:hypothetical protein